MKALRPLEKIKTWTLSSSAGEVVVERGTGIIRRLAVKRGRKLVDLMGQLRQNQVGYMGGLRIYDERDRKWYDDWSGRPRVVREQAEVMRPSRGNLGCSPWFDMPHGLC